MSGDRPQDLSRGNTSRHRGGARGRFAPPARTNRPPRRGAAFQRSHVQSGRAPGTDPRTGPEGAGGVEMTTVAVDTWFMIGRQARNLLRQPFWIVIMLTQPLFWLLL